MSVIINQSMFVGEFAIAAGPLGSADLQALISATETQIIKELFGNVMAASFIADISSGAPVNPDYVVLFDTLLLDNPATFEDYSTGIVEMLKCFVYTHWYSSRQMSPSSQGGKKQQSSNSSNFPDNSFFMHKYRNLGIANYKVIQEYIGDNSVNYPDFKGVSKQYTNIF